MFTTSTKEIGNDIVNLFGFKEVNEIKDNLPPLEELDLSVRSYNCIKRADIELDKLALMTEEELWTIRNLGHKSSAEVYLKLTPIRNYLKTRVENKDCYLYRNDINNNYCRLKDGIFANIDDYDDYDYYDDDYDLE